MVTTATPPTTRRPERAGGGRLPPWAAPVAVGVAAVAVCVVLAVVDPSDRAGWTPRCPFRAATGLDCPGCGGTRALAALLDGDLALAADHNVVTLALLPVLGYGWVGWFAHRIGWRATRPDLPTWSTWTLAIVLTVFTVARNLPWGPLAWLGSGAS